MGKLQPLYDTGAFDQIAFNVSFQTHATAEQIKDVLGKLEEKTRAAGGAKGRETVALGILRKLLTRRMTT